MADFLARPFMSSGSSPGLAGECNNLALGHTSIPGCAGCVYRTGQHLLENAITVGGTAPISKTTFGQQCSASVDGQVYGQPLVVTNVLYSLRRSRFRGGLPNLCR